MNWKVFVFCLQPKAKGQLLFDLVYEHLNLEECEYFGLSFYDRHDNLVSMFWLVSVLDTTRINVECHHQSNFDLDLSS